MSWELTLLSDWTSAGGIPLASLGPALPGSSLRRELSARGVLTLVLDAALAWELARDRAIVRVDGLASGGYAEGRIAGRSRQTLGAQGLQFTCTAHPRIYDLADSDLVRETLSGRTVFRFTENLTPRQYGDRFLWVHQEADRLVGVRWGTVEFLDPIPLSWERWTRGELFAAIVAATDAEVQWRIAADGAEEVDLLRRIGADAPVLPLAYGGLLQDHQVQEDYADLMTVARVAGEQATADSERATIAENWWAVTGVRAVGGGQHAVTLRAPTSEESPLLEDGQYCAHPALDLPARYLDAADGTAPCRIEATSVATSEFTVTGTPPALGSRVQIVADAASTPLETLELPSAVDAYGRVVRDLQIAGGRGERQYARNGGHAAGLALWAPVNGGGGTEYLRTELGRTFTALANGGRPAATPTTTPFTIDGMAAGTRLRRGMALRSGGVVLPVASDAVPDASGALTLTVDAPGLPGDFPDDSLFELIRREVRTWTLDGDHSVMAAGLRFTDSQTDLLPRGIPVSLDATASALVGTGLTADYIDPQLAAGPVLVSVPAIGGPLSALDQSTWPLQPFKALCASFPTIAPDGLSATLTVTGYAPTPGGPVLSPVAGTTRLRWRGTTGEINVARVTAIAGSVFTLVPESRPTLQIPSSAWYDAATGFWTFDMSNGVVSGGTTFSAELSRETRPLRLSGLRVSGTTVLPFKPQAVIATRPWLSTDTITLRRTITGTLDLTAVGTVVPLFDVDPDTGATFLSGYELTATFAPASSTLDEVAPGDYPPGGLWLQTGSSSLWRLESLVGTTATFLRPPTGAVALEVGLASVTWTRDDTYPLGAPASWGANGRATLTLAAPVPAGRSYARGLEVRANWHAAGQLRLFAAVAATATTVQVAGVDTWYATTTASTPRSYGVYRVVAGSTMPVPGQVLYVATSTVANGSGQADVTLTAPNAATIPDNTLFTVTVPALLPPGASPLGSVLRLTCPVGGATPEPFSVTPGYAHALFFVRVPEGATRQVTVRSQFTLSEAAWFAPQGPVCAIVDVTGSILGWSALDDEGLDVTTAPGVVELTTRAVIAASGLYAFRVYGGHATDFSRWCVHVQSMWYLGEALDAPFTAESFATPLMLTALRRLAQQAQPRIADRVEAALLELLTLDPTAIQLGGTVELSDFARVERITAIEEQPARAVAALEIGPLARDGAQLLGAGAIAAGVRRIR
ncbi:hypothetical protein [Gemmatimonas sp.]|uniref:hypothetical protein n=1 Tax=Gemmatimonas sp. TaxID=1962908 RepID=UPI0025B7F161|nr:hypothetical protein [Gemmatimonas sp.]MCA2992072.1 hypothetical protein [Gemmatimonas sp.]